MVQAEMTHHFVANHFNVSKITISMLMIRLRQTCLENTQCEHRREFPIILFEIGNENSNVDGKK
jgi:hypothetical protein